MLALNGSASSRPRLSALLKQRRRRGARSTSLRRVPDSVPKEDAGRLVPLSEAVMEMRTRIAMTRGSPEEVERSISLLRSWAPNVQQAIAAENRLRDLHGLPLTLEATPHER